MEEEQEEGNIQPIVKKIGKLDCLNGDNPGNQGDLCILCYVFMLVGG
jgi:hypothetical protein